MGHPVDAKLVLVADADVSSFVRTYSRERERERERECETVYN